MKSESAARSAVFQLTEVGAPGGGGVVVGLAGGAVVWVGVTVLGGVVLVTGGLDVWVGGLGVVVLAAGVVVVAAAEVCVGGGGVVVTTERLVVPTVGVPEVVVPEVGAPLAGASGLMLAGGVVVVVVVVAGAVVVGPGVTGGMKNWCGNLPGGGKMMATRSRPSKLANGWTTAVWVADPGVLSTLITLPTGTSGTYGVLLSDPRVTRSSPTRMSDVWLYWIRSRVPFLPPLTDACGVGPAVTYADGDARVGQQLARSRSRRTPGRRCRSARGR